MSPASHGLAGALVSCAALELSTGFDEVVSPVPFVVFGILCGQLPDLDLVLHAVFSKEQRIRNPLLNHRGYGHSIWAHFLLSGLSPFCFGVSDVNSSLYWMVAAITWMQFAVHLLLDMIDGSTGVHYFAPFHRSPIRLFPLVIDIDQELFEGTPGARAKVRSRVVCEAGFVCFPLLILIWIFMGT